MGEIEEKSKDELLSEFLDKLREDYKVTVITATQPKRYTSPDQSFVRPPRLDNEVIIIDHISLLK